MNLSLATPSPLESGKGPEIPVAGRPARWLPLRADAARASWIVPTTSPRIGDAIDIELRIDAKGDWVADLDTAERLFRRWPFPQNVRLIEILEPVVEDGPVVHFRLRVRVDPSEPAVRIPATTLAYFSPTLDRFLTLVVPAAELDIKPPEPFAPGNIVAPVGTHSQGPGARWWSQPGFPLALLGVSVTLALLWLRLVRAMRSKEFSNNEGTRSLQRCLAIEPATLPPRTSQSAPQAGPCELGDPRPTSDPFASLMDKLAMCCGLLPGQQTAAEIWTAVAKSNQFNTAELETLRRDLGDADALRFGGDAAPIESIERVQYRLQGWLKRIENPVGGESS